MTSLIALLLFSSICFSANASIQCIDSQGKAVDWFILYKLPKDSDSSNENIANGLAFYYMDVNAQFWKLSDKPINGTGHASWYTLNQVYEDKKKQDHFYAMYNDETPSGGKTSTHGHTKGAMAFDSDTGFWLIHSVPKFPPAAADGYDYPESGHTYGQTFLCVSLSSSDLNNLGQQLQYNYPLIYDHNLPDNMASEFPKLADAMEKEHIKEAPWYSITKFKSLAKQEFVNFAKFTSFDADLYDDLVAPYFQSPLFVETWQNGRGKMSSNCSATYQVMNIEEMSIEGVDFKETHDHSKWAVTTDLDVFKAGRLWICIGDINRMDSQKERAGGTMCSVLPNVWLSFQKSISKFDKCGKRKHMLQKWLSQNRVGPKHQGKFTLL